MTSKNFAGVLALATAALLPVACTVVSEEPASARVDCGTPGPHGVDCRIQRTGGTGGFEACWTLVIGCGNGGGMSAATCHEVAAGIAGSSANMPVAGFSNQDTCDVPASGRVERLRITAR